jgi:photosystem II stability/assembly factor-like uncharacterized protein
MRAMFLCFFLLSFLLTAAQKKQFLPDNKDSMPFSLDALSFRSIGPSLMSGRIFDLAVNPQQPSTYYVAAASGGVWKTINNGVTYDPIFDNEGSFSIGAITLDPNNPHTVWVGTGEANNQRSVAYGDGVYRSEDGGKSWRNMGLGTSEHIARIVIDPSDSRTIYVAAYGPLWSNGGQRGIFKSTDGGETWKESLVVSQYTGFCDVLMDPRNSDVLYAVAHQRQRKVYGFVDGGPESAVYKTTDGGMKWTKLTNGLPGGDVGRIGLALAPSNPDVLYAIVEAQEGKSGFFKSIDRGASWSKQSGHYTSGNYYQRIFVDPINENKVYSCDMMLGITLDGGITWNDVPTKNKHVDNHVVYIDPKNTSHLLVGCDGGLYETWDAAANWHYKQNLPITQFYKVSTDNASPFYNVYGGTQDNNSLAGPSRTINNFGIDNSKWIITVGGDGYETQVDPSDDNIVYAQWQYGGLTRFDKKSGESLDIKPIEKAGEPAYRWNWDAPLVISRHSNTRLYFGANKLFRTDDRGNTWQVISPDLTRQTDRNKLPIMDKIWGMDAVAKNESTDIFGQLMTIAESSLDEKLIYVGTDDGLIQVTFDGGVTWNKIDNIPGVPAMSYVNMIICSQHDRNTAYAVFNHHRYGDFHPYIFRTTDAGRTWSAIQSNLPERGTVYCIAEDHVNKNLLFVGTEFGVFTTLNGGGKWWPLKGGLPTICVKDMEIQRRENDLVLASFGRGFFILDDYSSLRYMNPEQYNKQAVIFPVKDALMFDEATPLGGWGESPVGSMGASFYAAPNPKMGAVFTYLIKDDVKTIKQKRQAAESELVKQNKPIAYPSADSIRLEDNQEKPHLLFTIYDANGSAVRRMKTAVSKGLNRAVWDFRISSGSYYNAEDGGSGFKVTPGTYKVGLHKFENGLYTEMVAPVSFKAIPLNWNQLAATDKQQVQSFIEKVNELRRVCDGTFNYVSIMKEKILQAKKSIVTAPQVPLSIQQQVTTIQQQLTDLDMLMYGDRSLSKRQFETLPTVHDRINNIVYGLWNVTAGPTNTYLQSYDIALGQFDVLYTQVKSADAALKSLLAQLAQYKIPAIDGELPEWK